VVLTFGKIPGISLRMSSKKTELDDILSQSPEMKYDNRLIEKKMEHGFLTRQERDSHLKGLPEESDFAFTSMDEIEKEDPTA